MASKLCVGSLINNVALQSVHLAEIIGIVIIVFKLYSVGLLNGVETFHGLMYG